MKGYNAILILFLGVRCSQPPNEPTTTITNCPLTDLAISDSTFQWLKGNYAIPEHHLSLSLDRKSVEYRFHGEVYQIGEETINTRSRNLNNNLNKQLTLYRDDACDELAHLETDTSLSFHEKVKERRLIKDSYIKNCMRAINGLTGASTDKTMQYSCDFVQQDVSNRNELHLTTPSYLGDNNFLKLHFEPSNPRVAGKVSANYGVERFYRLDNQHQSIFHIARSQLPQELRSLDLWITVFVSQSGIDIQHCSFEWRYS